MVVQNYRCNIHPIYRRQIASDHQPWQVWLLRLAEPGRLGASILHEIGQSRRENVQEIGPFGEMFHSLGRKPVGFAARATDGFRPLDLGHPIGLEDRQRPVDGGLVDGRPGQGMPVQIRQDVVAAGTGLVSQSQQDERFHETEQVPHPARAAFAPMPRTNLASWLGKTFGRWYS